MNNSKMVRGGVVLVAGWVLPHVLYWPGVALAAVVGHTSSDLLAFYLALVFFAGTVGAAVGLVRLTDSWPVRIAAILFHAGVQVGMVFVSLLLTGGVFAMFQGG